MKKYLRLFLINLAAIWLAVYSLEGVDYRGGFRTLAMAALVLTVINFAIKPLIKILLLPINLLTMGTFRWLINVASLHLTTMIVPQFTVSAFRFPGFTYQGFVFPAVSLSAFWALVVTSLIISLTAVLLLWLAKK